MGAKLTKEEILGADDIVTEDVEVPEWKQKTGADTVTIKALTGEERDRYESSLIVQGKGRSTRFNFTNARAKLVATTLVNGDGTPMFGEADVRLLGKKSAAVLDRLYDVARRLSGISDEDEKELIETFADAPNDGSTSDSHSVSVGQ